MASIETTSARRVIAAKPASRADRVFFRAIGIAANFSLVLVALILTFLSIRAFPAFEQQGIAFVFGSTWNAASEPPVFQLFPMLYGSLLVAAIGLVFAIPMAIAFAYFIVFIARGKVASAATSLVDFLAALPSVVLGLWGLYVFSPVAAHWSELLNKSLGFIPIFANTTENFLRTPFIAGMVIAVMIVPIIASVAREMFSQIDKDLINGALALGAGRASVFRRVILPTSSSGIVGGALLGFGRALGETVAIFFVLNLVFEVNLFQILEPKGGSVASHILAKFGEAGPDEVIALMAAGVVLFVMTLIVNTIAAWIVNRAQPWRNS